MNEPVRIVADWLNDTTANAVGVADVRAVDDFPKDAGDTLPAVPAFYDSTRHAFAARGVWPQANQGVTYPCVVTRFGGIDYPQKARPATTGAMQKAGTCTLHVIVAHRLQDSDKGVEDVGYLVRAVHNSLEVLNLPANLETARRRNGFELTECTELRVVPMPLEHEDNVIATALVLTYTSHETTYNSA